jgi:hypothetical protein
MMMRIDAITNGLEGTVHLRTRECWHRSIMTIVGHLDAKKIDLEQLTTKFKNEYNTVDFEQLDSVILEIKQASWVDKLKPGIVAGILSDFNRRITDHLVNTAQRIKKTAKMALISDVLGQGACLVLEEGARLLSQFDTIATLDPSIPVTKEHMMFKVWFEGQLSGGLKCIQSWCTPKLIEKLHIVIVGCEGSEAAERHNGEHGISPVLDAKLMGLPSIIQWLQDNAVGVVAEFNTQTVRAAKIDHVADRPTFQATIENVQLRASNSDFHQELRRNPLDYQFAEQVQTYLVLCQTFPFKVDSTLQRLFKECDEEVTCLLTLECSSAVRGWANSLTNIKQWVKSDEIEINLNGHVQTACTFLRMVHVVTSSCPNVKRFFARGVANLQWESELNSFARDFQEAILNLIWMESIKPLCRYYVATKSLAALDVYLNATVGTNTIKFKAIRSDVFTALCRMAMQTTPPMLTSCPDQYCSDELDSEFLEFAHSFFDTENAIMDRKFIFCIQQYRKCLRRRVDDIDDRIFDIEESGSLNRSHVKQFRTVSCLVFQLQWIFEKRFHGAYTAMLGCELVAAELNMDFFVAQIQDLIVRLETFLKSQTLLHEQLVHSYHLSESVQQLDLFAKVVNASSSCLNRTDLDKTHGELYTALSCVVEADIQYFESHDLLDWNHKCHIDHDSQGHCKKDKLPVEPKRLLSTLKEASIFDSRCEVLLSRLNTIIRRQVDACVDLLNKSTHYEYFRARREQLRQSCSALPTYAYDYIQSAMRGTIDERGAYLQRVEFRTLRQAKEYSNSTSSDASILDVLKRVEALCEKSQAKALKAIDKILICVQTGSKREHGCKSENNVRNDDTDDESVQVGNGTTGNETTPEIGCPQCMPGKVSGLMSEIAVGSFDCRPDAEFPAYPAPDQIACGCARKVFTLVNRTNGEENELLVAFSKLEKKACKMTQPHSERDTLCFTSELGIRLENGQADLVHTSRNKYRLFIAVRANMITVTVTALNLSRVVDLDVLSPPAMSTSAMMAPLKAYGCTTVALTVDCSVATWGGIAATAGREFGCTSRDSLVLHSKHGLVFDASEVLGSSAEGLDLYMSLEPTLLQIHQVSVDRDHDKSSVAVPYTVLASNAAYHMLDDTAAEELVPPLAIALTRPSKIYRMLKRDLECTACGATRHFRDESRDLGPVATPREVPGAWQSSRLQAESSTVNVGNTTAAIATIVNAKTAATIITTVTAAQWNASDDEGDTDE